MLGYNSQSVPWYLLIAKVSLGVPSLREPGLRHDVSPDPLKTKGYTLGG